MRKIEEQMLEAIRHKENWSHANTEVKIFSEGKVNKLTYYGAYVCLHGHIIAIVNYLNDNSVHINLETLSDYPTRTTKSRLRALSCDVKTEGGITYVWGRSLHSRLDGLVDYPKYFPTLEPSITKVAPQPTSMWDEEYWVA